MAADFGADLDAALNGALGVVRAAAAAAKERVDAAVAAVPVAAPAPDFPTPPRGTPVPPRPAAAVSFDIVESPLEFGGAPPSDEPPLPEEIPGR